MTAKLYRVLGGAALLVGAATQCTSAVDIHSLRSPAAHFERYRTFAFDVRAQAPNKYETSARSADVRDHVQQIAASILQSRGYILSPIEQADLIVRVEAGRRQYKIPMSTGTMPLGGGVAGLSAQTGDGNVPGPAEVEATYHGQLDQEELDFVEGAFVIDAFDGKTRDLLWHGFARTEVTPGPVDYARVRQATESVLASFPATEIKALH
jgi:uncharacterized protein DUF4136